jgi:DNA-binding CsgD family transcriptional regulator/tetratricopeptide (TPR) repeat protein
VIDWPTEQRVIGLAEGGPDERTVARGLGRSAGIAGRGLADAPVGLSWLWQVLGSSQAAREQWAELLRLAATSAEREVRAEALNVVGRFASAAGDLATAHTFYQEALVAGRAGQDSASVARSLSGLAQIAASRGAFDLARTLEEEGLAIRRRLGDAAEVARSLAVLAWFTLESRGAAQAEALHEESLTVRVTLGEPLALGYSLVHLGWLAHLMGQRELARQHLAEALTTVRSCTDRWKVVALLALLGRPSPIEPPTRQAVLLLTAAEALEASVGRADDSVGLEDHLAEARQRLDPRALAVAWGGGRDVEADSLVEQALRSGGSSTTPRDRNGCVGAPEPMPLTPREMEVATLISRGHTNRRIAEVLVIAERTAETHARNIREKLGLTTRSQIAAWAALYTAPSSSAQ